MIPVNPIVTATVDLATHFAPVLGAIVIALVVCVVAIALMARAALRAGEARPLVFGSGYSDRLTTSSARGPRGTAPPPLAA